MNFKKILQLCEPDPGEPLCSGAELTLAKGETLAMAHFHTVVRIKNSRARSWLQSLSTTSGLTLDCSVSINGKQYEQQLFSVTPGKIGLTLFCAGFPCITITGVDEENEQITFTISEIVVICEPGKC